WSMTGRDPTPYEREYAGRKGLNALMDILSSRGGMVLCMDDDNITTEHKDEKDDQEGELHATIESSHVDEQVTKFVVDDKADDISNRKDEDVYIPDMSWMEEDDPKSAYEEYQHFIRDESSKVSLQGKETHIDHEGGGNGDNVTKKDKSLSESCAADDMDASSRKSNRKRKVTSKLKDLLEEKDKASKAAKHKKKESLREDGGEKSLMEIKARTLATCNSDPENRDIPLNLYLQNTTLDSTKQLEPFVARAQRMLPPNAAPFQVVASSTFLSTTVRVGASSAVWDELLDSARFLPSEIRITALVIYMVCAGDEVVIEEAILLDEGLHHVPYITSATGLTDRTIMIKGMYLDNVGINATTQSYGEILLLNVIYYQKLDQEGLEMLLAQLPKGRPLKQGISIHAKKTIQLERCTTGLVLRSNDQLVSITKKDSSQHVTGVLCSKSLWTIFLVFLCYQAIIMSTRHYFQLKWIFSFFIWFLCYLLLNYIIGPWTYNIIIHCLELIMRIKYFCYILTSRELVDLKLLATTEVEGFGANNKTKGNSNVSTTLSLSRQDDCIEDAIEDALEGGHIHRYQLKDECSEDHITTPRIDTMMPVNDPNWEWPCFEQILRGGRWVVERAAAKGEVDTSVKWPFHVVTNIEPNSGIESVRLVIQSPYLIRVLKDCQPQTGYKFAKGSSINPTELFLRLGSLKQYILAGNIGAKEDVSATGESVWHVSHLVRFVERHFTDTMVQHERMKAEGCVSFEMLWTFFVPGDGVCRRCDVTNQECFGIIKRCKKSINADGTPYWRVTLNVMDFNVQSYHNCTMDYKIQTFDGEVPFTSLQVCPLRFCPNRKELEARFVSMGTTFYQLAMQQPFRFMQFKGSMNFFSYEGGCWRLRKLNADGRVMVDLLSFARMNPDYHLGNAQPPCDVMTGMWRPTTQMKQPGPEELVLAPAFVYGFSFRLKRWGCFEVCAFRDISFNERAFDALRMKDESQKAILLSVVKSYILKGEGSTMQDEESIDLIANKGTGCIVLCHGPPGTGKTLTAEALAESLQCALWSISAFELGEEAAEVEARLIQIMEIAYNWRAILLLDEADAYLQRREEGVDVKRNLLTGVFLRVLEYHRGVMFLTTNRVTVFDDAILSRITLAISYPALEDSQRRDIWQTLLLRAGIRNATYDALLLRHFNGRQIRNIVHLAQLLAAGRKQNLDITHVIEAINASVSCINELPALS
ncbi:hypothetical protein GOP47_0002775, partial [Adiantum capillus-veneris]